MAPAGSLFAGSAAFSAGALGFTEGALGFTEGAALGFALLADAGAFSGFGASAAAAGGAVPTPRTVATTSGPTRRRAMLG